MSLRFASARLADDRQDAQLSIERAGDQEGQLEALVGPAEGDVRHAGAAVLHAAGVLQNAGVVVRSAADGLEALIAAYEKRSDVIVMDVPMPVLDGLEATRLIDVCAAPRDARVIAYTGNPSFDESPTRMLFAAVLTEPATADAVLAAVRHTASL